MSFWGTPPTCFEELSLIDLEWHDWPVSPGFPSVPTSPALRCQAHMLYQHIHLSSEERTHVLILTSRVLPDWALPGVPRQDIRNQNAELLSRLAQLWKQNTHLPLVISLFLSSSFLIVQQWMVEGTEYPAVILLTAPFLLTGLLFLNCLTS